MKINTFSPTTLRRIIQSAFAAYCLFIGWRFHAFLQWAAGNGPEAARPASVEAFLPISALMSFKRLLLSGNWDPIHPAGLAFLIIALLIAWLFRKGFCGYICPIGLISNTLSSLGNRLGLDKVPPKPADRALGSIKYALLGFFIYTTFLAMPLPAIEQFLRSPYNMTADARMMQFFLDMSATAAVVLTALAIAGVVIRNFWCRYLCPYGALLGLVSLLSPLSINRKKKLCIHCSKCTKACPGAIDVEDKLTVNSTQCIGCTACIEACPVDGCLSVTAGKKKLPFWSIALGTVALLLIGYLIADATGHWNANLPDNMARMLYGRFGG